jgi:hypothetical protein
MWLLGINACINISTIVLIILIIRHLRATRRETKSINLQTAEKLTVMQRAMERKILEISLRDCIRNEEIRRRTKVTDILTRLASLKWRWAGHLARRDDERSAKSIIIWRSWLAMCPRGRPPTFWTDDLVETAGINWMQNAQDRKMWRGMEEAIVLQ